MTDDWSLQLKNKILDTRSYNVEFLDGQESAYMAYLFTGSMYAQFNVDFNQHLLCKTMVDNESDEHATSLIVGNAKLNNIKTTAEWTLVIK